MVHVTFEMFNRIGSEWVMWVLMALSVVSFAVVFERFRNLRNQERVGSLLWKEKLEAWMKTGKLAESEGLSPLEIKKVIQHYPCLETSLLEVLVSAGDKQGLSLLMASFLGRKKVELDQNLSFLGSLGSNAPFIGLFGTVLGIIKAFHDIGSGVSQTAGASSVSAGLSEALVATAVGLLVAIPAILAFNFFQRKIKVILSRAESLGNWYISAQGKL